jgi:trans-aconitate methyltransferase
MWVKIDPFIRELLEKECLLQAVISSPLSKAAPISRVTLRPVLSKGHVYYQASSQKKEQVFHENLTKEQMISLLINQLQHAFKQALIQTAQHDYHLLMNRNRELTICTKPPTKKMPSLSHNRKKHYLLPEGYPVPFLIELGVMDGSGKVLAKKRDKFLQINRFLEMVEDILPHFANQETVHIVDFGCGKSSLTFALYHHLSLEGRIIKIHGLDLKVEVIAQCEALARRLNYEGLHFSVGDIKDYHCAHTVDIVIALHACDTATDAVLEKAIQWQAKAILAVPCCQHELFHQVQNIALTPLLKHGILKERFAALVTDAARAQLLEIAGYHTQLLEFIDFEHTPKNLLIRALKRKSPYPLQADIEEYDAFKKALTITPSLEKRLSL